MSLQAFLLRVYLRSQFKGKAASVTLEEARANLEKMAGTAEPPTRVRITPETLGGVLISNNRMITVGRRGVPDLGAAP